MPLQRSNEYDRVGQITDIYYNEDVQWHSTAEEVKQTLYIIVNIILTSEMICLRVDPLIIVYCEHSYF